MLQHLRCNTTKLLYFAAAPARRPTNVLRAYAVEAGTQGGLLPKLSEVPQLGVVPSCRMYHRSVSPSLHSLVLLHRQRQQLAGHGGCL